MGIQASGMVLLARFTTLEPPCKVNVFVYEMQLWQCFVIVTSK